MATIKVGIIGLSIPDKVQYVRQITTNMTGNPNFAIPSPTLADVIAKADGLESAYNAAQVARQVAKAKTALQDTASAELDLIVTQLANYVENASGGDAGVIVSSGFSVKSPGAPIGELPAPTDVRVVAGPRSGTADIESGPVYGARSYLYERAEDAEVRNFQAAGASTRPKATLNSMVSGKKYWFRMAALGAAGQGPWSDPVPVIAP